MARQRYNPDTGEFEDDYDDEYGNNPTIAQDTADAQREAREAEERRRTGTTTAPSGNEYPDATGDRQGPSGQQEAENRAVRERQANELNDRLKLGDTGNLDSFLSGRASWEEYLQDQTARTTNTPGSDGDPRYTSPPAGAGQPPGPSAGLPDAYANYLGTPTAPSNQNSEMTGLLKTLIDNANADRQRQDEERKAMREILMGRLKTAQEPVSTETPGIKEVIAARRLESQRGSERERERFAERMAAQGLGDSGAFDSGVIGLEQDRSERDASAVAGILGSELQNKRQEIMALLDMAARLGDTEAARTLQAQLASLDAQLRQTELAEGSRRFESDLGFRKSSFLDDLGFRLMALQLGANRDAGLAFL